MPTATDITVLETLAKLDTDFAAAASAFENGQFALWVGSGISRQAPSLGGLIDKTLEYLRQKATDPTDGTLFLPALEEALNLANTSVAECDAHLSHKFTDWPNSGAIRKALWDKYSDLLDIRIEGKDEDFLLWEAMDIRGAFANPKPPACAHLSIAILLLEGAVKQIVSANWDGFIEAAVTQLAGNMSGNLQVVVDPNNLRDAPAKGRLLKFHGCIIHASEEPDDYRQFLIGSKSRILGWRDAPEAAAMRNELVSVATNLKTLMVGLSMQDVNLQAVFVSAKQANPWPWPCEPDAQGHIFCEDQLGNGHRQMLKIVYATTYNDNIADIQKSAHFQAWGEQFLLAMAIKVIVDKLAVLMNACLSEVTTAADIDRLWASLLRLRDQVAAAAEGDRTALLTRGISAWSRLISVFRDGTFPSDADRYQPISGVPVAGLVEDANTKATAFGEMGLCLTLLEIGQDAGLWQLALPGGTAVDDGVLKTKGTWMNSPDRPIYLVRSAGVALKLKSQGAFANDNAIIIHADDAWHQMSPDDQVSPSARTPSRAPGRTARVGPTHVSMAHLVATTGDLDSLFQRFNEAVTL